MGFQGTRWGRVAIIAFACWCIATSFVCFQKPDFLNVSYFCIDSLTQYLFHIANPRHSGCVPATRPTANQIIISKNPRVGTACHHVQSRQNSIREILVCIRATIEGRHDDRVSTGTDLPRIDCTDVRTEETGSSIDNLTLVTQVPLSREKWVVRR